MPYRRPTLLVLSEREMSPRYSRNPIDGNNIKAGGPCYWFVTSRTRSPPSSERMISQRTGARLPAFIIMMRLRVDEISIGSALLLAGRVFRALSISFLTVRVP